MNDFETLKLKLDPQTMVWLREGSRVQAEKLDVPDDVAEYAAALLVSQRWHDNVSDARRGRARREQAP